MSNQSTQFKTLIQNEMKRLESIVAHSDQTYPVVFRPYVFSRQRSKKAKISPYIRFLSFARMVQFLF
jgi:hypothetical protein